MKKVQVYETNEAKNLRWQASALEAEETGESMNVVNVYPDVRFQTFRGFGGAFTEAAAHSYAAVDDEKKKELIEAYFGESGLCYHFGRVTIHSCDFGLGNYTYIEDGDKDLKTFDVAHDRKEILPFIHDAQRKAQKPMEFLASPWSPPGFMKDSGEMNNGGKLLPEYADAWANYFVKFIEAYRKEGVPVSYITIQNEPAAAQTWDSCLYSAEEEGRFAANYLAPALKAAGLSEVRIFAWDHNKEAAYERLRGTLSVPGASDVIHGCALHWYTGDHFDCTALINKQFPDKEVFFSEGCVEYSRFADSRETEKAEMYAHDIIGNLNAGITASFDWNLFVDLDGGPNHAGNLCPAPIMIDTAAGTYEKRLTYFYLGQFSKFIQPKAVRLGTTKYTDKLEVTAFENPDGSHAVVLLNRSEEVLPVVLRENGYGVETEIVSHSIKTFFYT